MVEIGIWFGRGSGSKGGYVKRNERAGWCSSVDWAQVCEPKINERKFMG